MVGLGGGGSTYDYGFRIYNPQIGRFLSVDPLYMSFPYNSPYLYADNSPVVFIDEMGLNAARPGGGGRRKPASRWGRGPGGNPVALRNSASYAASILRNNPTQIRPLVNPGGSLGNNIRPADVVQNEFIRLTSTYRPPSSEPYNIPRTQLAELGEDRMTPISKDILTTIISTIDQLSSEIKSFTLAKSYIHGVMNGVNANISKEYYTGSDIYLDMSTSLRVEALDELYFAEVDKIARGDLSEEEFNALSVEELGFRNISAKFQLGLKGVQQPSVEIANRLLKREGEVISVERKEQPQLRRGE